MTIPEIHRNRSVTPKGYIKLKTALRSCWPNQNERLLLQASLGSGQEAITSWRQWRSSVAIENLDAGSWRLLPLLWHNLSQQGLQDPIFDTYKAVWQQTWIHNQMLMNAAGKVIRALSNEGIHPMLLKGIPLVLAYYENVGLRPMGDFDLLVNPNDLNRAVKVLQESGYRIAFGDFDKLGIIKHSIPFSCGDSQDLDLHCRAVRETVAAKEKLDFWETCVELDLNGQKVLAPGNADMLFNIIAHGLRWNPIPSFRWIADAGFVINRAGKNLDWNRLETQFRGCGLSHTLLKALLYLRKKLNFPIPNDVLQNLQRLPRSTGERLEFLSKTHLWGGLLAQWFQHTRLTPEQGVYHRIYTFPAYLSAIWNIESHQNLASAIFFRTFQRLRNPRTGPYNYKTYECKM